MPSFEVTVTQVLYRNATVALDAPDKDAASKAALAQANALELDFDDPDDYEFTVSDVRQAGGA